MLTPSVRSCSMLAAALVASLLLAAAPLHAQTGKPAMGAATPQAALDQLQASITKGDVSGALGVLTPAGRTQFTNDLVTQTLMFLVFMDPDDPMPGGPKDSPSALATKKKAYAAAKSEITAAFKPYGLDAAIGKPVMTAQPIVEKGVAKADAFDLSSKTYAAMAKAAPAFGQAQAGPLPLPLKVGPFTALKVDGGTATVKSGPRTLKFEQADGKWFLNFPLPEPAGPPQE